MAIKEKERPTVVGVADGSSGAKTNKPIVGAADSSPGVKTGESIPAQGLSAGNQAALKAAQDVIKRGQAIGDKSVVDVGMDAQRKILADGGISYAEAASGGRTGASKTGAMEQELKGLYGPRGTYATALAAQQRAQRAKVNQAVNTLEGQKESTNQSYSELFRQLYKEKKNAQKNIDQKMAAQGVTGGASESTLLGLETGYSEALRQGEQERVKTIGEIDRAITRAQLDGDIANAQLAAESARAQTSEYANVLQGMISWQDNQQAVRDANARQLALITAQGGEMPTDELLASAGLSRADVEGIVRNATYKRALEKAENLAEYGNFSGYAALNYTPEEIAAMKASNNKAIAVGNRVVGGGGNSMTLATAKAMAKNGLFTDDVLRVFHEAGFNDEYLKREYGYEPTDNMEYNGRAYQNLYNKIMTGSFSVSTLAGMIERGDFTNAQKDSLLTMLGY